MEEATEDAGEAGRSTAACAACALLAPASVGAVAVAVRAAEAEVDASRAGDAVVVVLGWYTSVEAAPFCAPVSAGTVAVPCTSPPDWLSSFARSE